MSLTRLPGVKSLTRLTLLHCMGGIIIIIALLIYVVTIIIISILIIHHHHHPSICSKLNMLTSHMSIVQGPE